MRVRKREIALGIAAAVFLALSGLCRMLPGVRFSMRLFLCAAVACALWIVLERLAERFRFWHAVRTAALVLFAAACLALAAAEILVLREAGRKPPETGADAVIVLGAGVNGEAPSLTLQTRIEAARSYLDRFPDTPAVLSGGQGGGERISEAECMRRALETGERKAPLLIEDRSTSTAENFAFSRELLEAEGFDVSRSTVAVVTSDFHLYRAKLLAQRCGFGEVVSVGAPLPWWWLSANYYIREAFAVVAAAILG